MQEKSAPCPLRWRQVPYAPVLAPTDNYYRKVTASAVAPQKPDMGSNTQKLVFGRVIPGWTHHQHSNLKVSETLPEDAPCSTAATTNATLTATEACSQPELLVNDDRRTWTESNTDKTSDGSIWTEIPELVNQAEEMLQHEVSSESIYIQNCDLSARFVQASEFCQLQTPSGTV